MKKIIYFLFLASFFICLCCSLSACQSARSAYKTTNTDTNTDTSLPRADSRYIGWLEKESIFNASPEKIKIVSGTQFAWNFSSEKHDKKNILSVSPVWLQVNPYQLAYKDQSPLKVFLNNTKLLKDAQINALYFYPTKNASFEDVYNNTAEKSSKQYSPTSLAISKDIGAERDLIQLGAQQIYTAGNILPASLGIGSDFLLALHGVREYPGLFMMVEVPKELWQILPLADEQNAFSPALLSELQLQQIKETGLIPHAFYRDYFQDFPHSSFAVSNEITGYDGVTRRWLYRYVNTPYTVVLNFYDPSFQTQRILAGSIIEEIGILKQGLVSISVQDIWGQESVHDQAKTKDISPLTSPQPALYTLEHLNRSVHGYGAWTFCRDTFSPELIKTVQNAQTDFAADTLIMPALEEAFAKESNAPLLKAFHILQEQKIDEQSLWHGTQRSFSHSPYTHASLTQFTMHTVNLSEQDCSMLKKMQKTPLFRENNQNLYSKLLQAEQLQFAFMGFQSLLPGLNFIALQDLVGVTKDEENFAPFQNTINQNILLFGSLPEQIHREASLIGKLQTIWNMRQEKQLHSAKILSVCQTKNPKTFAMSVETPAKQRLLICINLSAKAQQLSLKLHAKGSSFHKQLNPYELFYRFF